MSKAAVRDALAPLIRRGVAATCGMVETELLFSARNLTEHDDTGSDCEHWSGSSHLMRCGAASPRSSEHLPSVVSTGR